MALVQNSQSGGFLGGSAVFLNHAVIVREPFKVTHPVVMNMPVPMCDIFPAVRIRYERSSD